jgi:DNA-binding response OmpR family regulator
MDFLPGALFEPALAKPDPVASPLASAPCPDVQPEPKSLSDRILVVDDNAALRETLKCMLRLEAYNVSCAEDGEAGWDALCADRFDVLITDHEMPRLTGLDLLRRVRALPLKIPVILTSGRMPWHEPDLTRLLPPGVAMPKPFSLADLLANVRHMLSPTARADANAGGQISLGFERMQTP